MRQLRLLLILILGFAWSQDLFAQDDPSPVQTICEGTIRPYRVDKDENGGAGTTNAQYAWSITSGTFLGTITTNQGPVVARPLEVPTESSSTGALQHLETTCLR